MAHRKFPLSFILLAAILAIPTILYSFVRMAEMADECHSIKMSPATAAQRAHQCE